MVDVYVNSLVNLLDTLKVTTYYKVTNLIIIIIIIYSSRTKSKNAHYDSNLGDTLYRNGKHTIYISIDTI